MASGSIESSSITPSFAFETSLANPHESPIGSPHQTPFTANPLDQTPLADTDTAPTPSNHATPEPEPPVAQARHDESDISDPSSDEDAEGEEDDDYEENQPAPRSASPESVTSQTQSHSDASSRSQKRKRSQDEEYDYIQANPELYGMRRSGRARPQRGNVIDSDSENSDDTVGRRRQKKPKTKPTPRPSKPVTPVVRQIYSDDDESDGYIQNKKKVDTRRDKERKHKILAGQLPPTLGNARVDTRAKSAVNYAVDEEDEDSDDFIDHNYVEVDTGPKIDEVLDHRLPEGREWDPSLKADDFEYLIRWQGESNLHAKFYTYEDLKSRGLRLDKVRNYFLKDYGPYGEIYHMTAPEVDEEDKEAFAMRQEERREQFLDSQNIYRVIGEREEEHGTDSEFFCLWKGLGYDQASWEAESTVRELASGQIDAFYDRDHELAKSKPRSGARHVPLQEQPSYIKGGKLRDFQLKGLNFLAHSYCANKNVILADEMGLGKTVQTVSWLSWLKNSQGQQGPFLVVVPLSTMPAWADTFDKWAPDINYVQYHGRAAAREIIKEYELLVENDPKRPKFHVLLTTFELVLKDEKFLSEVKWQALVVDEAHRLKNKEAKLYIALQNLHIPSRLLLTGTPLQNNLAELSALMHFIMPGEVDIDEDLDLASEGAVEQLNHVNEVIRRFMLRRTKKMVMHDLPPCTEKILRVPLSNYQTELYKLIVNKNYAELNKGDGPKHSLLNVMMELKKCCNHPFLVGNSRAELVEEDATKEEYLRSLITNSGKLMLLEQLLAKLKREGHRVLIFTQMVQQLNILSDYMRQRQYKHQRLDGTTQRAARERAMAQFQAPDSDDFAFILSTRAGGLGLNLMAADTVIIFDSDWNPQADIQAVSRAHRMGQTKPVTAYRFVSKDTVEEQIQERARNKRILEYLTIQRGWVDDEKKQLDKQMRANGIGVDEPTTRDDVSRLLKQGSAKMFAQSSTDNQKSLEELDIDAMVESADLVVNDNEDNFLADGGDDFMKSFHYTDVQVELEWDNIIPKEQLEQLKEEERRRREVMETEALIEQSKPRNRKKPTNDDGSGATSRRERAANRRAKQSTRRAASESSEEDANDSEEDLDPKRPLDLNETRRLIEAYKKFGGFEECKEQILKEAKLTTRDETVLKAVIEAVYAEAQVQLAKADQEAARNGISANQKKERKEVLFDFRGTKNQNANTIIDRPIEMDMVRKFVGRHTDWRDTRITSAKKGADYTCDWGAREDGMLVVGISRHGFGAWADIRDDPELEMSDKLFLEEKRVGAQKELKEKKDKGEKIKERKPQATHLVRRINYLLDALKVQEGVNISDHARQALENHHRNRRRQLIHDTVDASAASSPVARAGTPQSRKRKPEDKRNRKRGDSRADPTRADTLERTTSDSRPIKKSRMSSSNIKNPYAALNVKPASPAHHNDHGNHHRRDSNEFKRKRSPTPDPDAEDGEIREPKRPRSSEGPNGDYHQSPAYKLNHASPGSPALNGLPFGGIDRVGPSRIKHERPRDLASPYHVKTERRSRSADRIIKREDSRRDRSMSRRGETEERGNPLRQSTDRPESRNQGRDNSRYAKPQQNGHQFHPYSREGRRSRSPSKTVQGASPATKPAVGGAQNGDASKAKKVVPKKKLIPPPGLPPKPPPPVDILVSQTLDPQMSAWKVDVRDWRKAGKKNGNNPSVQVICAIFNSMHDKIKQCEAALPNKSDIADSAWDYIAHFVFEGKSDGAKVREMYAKVKVDQRSKAEGANVPSS